MSDIWDDGLKKQLGKALNLYSAGIGRNLGQKKDRLLSDTALRIFSDNIQNLASGGTGSQRRAIDLLRSSILLVNKIISEDELKTQLETKINITKSQKDDPAAAKKSFASAIELINTQIFVALDPKSKDSGSKQQKILKNLLNETYNLYGQRDATPRNSMHRVLTKNGFNISIDETSDTVEEEEHLFIKNSELKQSSIRAEIKQYILNTVDNIDETSTQIFKTKIPTIQEFGTQTKIVKSITAKFLYKYIAGGTSVAEQYIFYVVKFKTTFTIEKGIIFNESNEEKQTQYVKPSIGEVDFSKTEQTNRTDRLESNREQVIENTVTGENDEILVKGIVSNLKVAKIASEDNINYANALLKAEAEATSEGRSIFDYGHLISAATVKLGNIYQLVKDFTWPNVDDPSVTAARKKFDNIKNSILMILTISSRVDSILENIYDPDVKGLTKQDIVSILQRDGANFSVEELYVYEKKDSLAVKKATISRKIELGIQEDKQTQYLIGVMERRRFNAEVKGALSALLLKMLREQAATGFEEVLTLDSVIRYLATFTGSDSLASAALKQTLGAGKINKGSSKIVYTKTKIKKGKVFKNLPKTNIPKPISVPKTALIKNKSPSKSSSSGLPKQIKTTGNPTVRKTKRDEASTDLVALVNAEIGNMLLANMGKNGSLENRSGRFRESVRALGIANNSLSFKYEKNPYEIFDKNTGKSPWNTTARDPETLIENSIRTILRKYRKNNLEVKGV